MRVIRHISHYRIRISTVFHNNRESDTFIGIEMQPIWKREISKHFIISHPILEVIRCTKYFLQPATINNAFHSLLKLRM